MGRWSASQHCPAKRHWSGLILFVALLVTGCLGQQSAVYPPPIIPAQDLHLPGLVKLASVSTLETQTHTPWLSDPIGYLPPGATEPHILFQLGFGRLDTVYDVGLDGSGLRRIPLGTQCYPGYAVSPDGRAVVCRTADGLWRQVLGGARPSASTGQALVGPAPGYAESLTWTADGQYLTTLGYQGDGCRIALYGPGAQAKVEALTGTIALPLAGLLDLSPLFPYSPPCPFTSASWSPDGRWLALAGNDMPTDVDFVLLLPTAPIWRALAHGGRQPVVPLGLDGSKRLNNLLGVDLPRAWSADASTLASPNKIGDQFEQTSVATGMTTPLITLPGPGYGQSHSFDYSWAPVGRQFIFVLSTHVLGDQIPPPATLYVYTPQT